VSNSISSLATFEAKKYKKPEHLGVNKNALCGKLSTYLKSLNILSQGSIWNIDH
jgi:hypothetical protein